MRLLLLLLLSAGGCVNLASSLSTGEYETIYEDMKRYFGQNGPSLPTAVRLAFHDCVLRCNGCLNRNNEANVGLPDFVDEMESLYQDSGYGQLYDLSRADFWAISGLAAIGAGIKKANKRCEDEDASPDCILVPDLSVTFRWGREDCPTSPETDEVLLLPEPTMTGPEMFDYFANGTGMGFGFKKREVAALLGAHTLGGANNTGYGGPWIAGEVNIFDNHYYTMMANTSLIWQTRNHGRGEGEDARWQFNAFEEEVSNETRKAFMLSTDMELFYKLRLTDDEEAMPTCQVPDRDHHEGEEGVCQKSGTYDVAYNFAENMDWWVGNFSRVFEKMIENGYVDGELQQLTA